MQKMKKNEMLQRMHSGFVNSNQIALTHKNWIFFLCCSFHNLSPFIRNATIRNQSIIMISRSFDSMNLCWNTIFQNWYFVLVKMFSNGWKYTQKEKWKKMKKNSIEWTNKSLLFMRQPVLRHRMQTQSKKEKERKKKRIRNAKALK